MYRVQVENQGNCSDLSAVAWVIEAGTGIYTKTSCDCGLAIASILLLIFWLYWKHLETESHGERSQVLLDVTNDDAWFEAGFFGPWHARWKNHHSFGHSNKASNSGVYEEFWAMPIRKFALICSFLPTALGFCSMNRQHDLWTFKVSTVFYSNYRICLYNFYAVCSWCSFTLWEFNIWKINMKITSFNDSTGKSSNLTGPSIP